MDLPHQFPVLNKRFRSHAIFSVSCVRICVNQLESNVEQNKTYYVYFEIFELIAHKKWWNDYFLYFTINIISCNWLTENYCPYYIWNKNNFKRIMVESRVYFNNFYLLRILRTTIPIRMTVFEISWTHSDIEYAQNHVLSISREEFKLYF